MHGCRIHASHGLLCFPLYTRRPVRQGKRILITIILSDAQVVMTSSLTYTWSSSADACDGYRADVANILGPYGVLQDLEFPNVRQQITHLRGSHNLTQPVVDRVANTTGQGCCHGHNTDYFQDREHSQWFVHPHVRLHAVVSGTFMMLAIHSLGSGTYSVYKTAVPRMHLHLTSLGTMTHQSNGLRSCLVSVSSTCKIVLKQQHWLRCHALIKSPGRVFLCRGPLNVSLAGLCFCL